MRSPVFQIAYSGLYEKILEHKRVDVVHGFCSVGGHAVSDHSGKTPADADGQHPQPYPEPKDRAASYIQKASEHYFYREFSQAADNYHKAIALYKERKDIHHVATTYNALADLYVWAREPEEAEKYYLIAAQHHAQTDNLMEQANSIKEIAGMHVKYEKFQEAEKRYTQSLGLLKSEKPNRVVGSIHEGMGHMYWKANQIPEAIDSFTHARDTFATLHYNLGVAQTTGALKRLNRLLKKQHQRESSSKKDNASH